MQRIVLGAWMILCLFRTNAILSQTSIDYNRYIRSSERCFDVQNFDSCLYYHYILAHYYANKHDNAGLVNAWYNIAIIDLLQKKYAQAKAAQTIACQYILHNMNNYNDLRNIYYSILDVKNQASRKLLPSITLNLTGLKPALLRKLYYMPQLSKAEYEYNNDQLTQAKETLWQLLHDLKEKSDTNWFGYAKANMLIGEILYTIDDYIHSLVYYEIAIHIYESNNIFDDDWMTAYNHFLYDLLFTGQSEKRDSCFRRIERSNLINKNRARYYFIKGDFVRSISYEEAIEAYLQAYNSPLLGVVSRNKLISRIAYFYVRTEQYDQAMVWLKKLDTVNMENYDKARIAYSYFKLGDINRGDALMKGIENKELDYNEDILFWLSKYYFETKNYDKAGVYYNLYALYLLKAYENEHYYTMNGFSALGYFYWYGKADYWRSLQYYHKAVFELVKEHAPADIYQMPDINQSINDQFLTRELNNKGEAFYAVSKLRKTKVEILRDLKASLANFELSFTVAHKYKMSLSRDEQRYEYANYIQHRFPYIINVCLDLYQKTSQQVYANKAFEYAEKSKASLLLSTVRGANAGKIHMVPDNLKRAEEQTWTKTELISNYLSESYKAPDVNRAKIDRYNVMLGQLKRQQDSLLHIFKVKYPAYYNARYNTDVIKADSLQKLLKPDEAMLEYSISADRVVIYLLTHSDFMIFTDTLGTQFFADIEAYRKKLSGFSYDDLRDTMIRTFAKQANRLYNCLVKPAAPYIKGKKLMIVPDDVLTQIPFEALVTAPLSVTDTASFVTLPYLVKEHSITYSYSGTLYAMNHQASTYHNAKLLAVAPGYGKMRLSRFTATDTANMQHDTAELLPIPGTYEEVKGIHRIFGGKILMRKWATEKRFKELAGQYDILHLATHGIINNEYPMSSELVFIPAKDSVNNGLLNTYEIYNMRINAPLVVLSACNTGYGKLNKGEGIMSLTRGFLTAGAKSIVMTMWAVDDKTSSTLMKGFYTNLAAKQNIGDALNNAKLEYLNQSDDLKAHPYFWAGYIVLGNTSATFEPYHPQTKYYIWIGMLVLVMVGVIFITKNRRSLRLRR